MKLIQINESIKLSKVEKIDGIYSWSLPAGTSCPGQMDRKGNIKDACKACYAKRGHYNYPNPTKIREHNMKDWKRKEWVTDMIQALDILGRFRWFDSGDIYHPELAKKIYEVIKNTPWVRHWLPTQSYDIPRIRPWIKKIEQLPNVVVRKSTGSVSGHILDDEVCSTIYTDPSQLPDSVYQCPIGTEKNRKRCEGCRACFDKNIKAVAYKKH